MQKKFLKAFVILLLIGAGFFLSLSVGSAYIPTKDVIKIILGKLFDPSLLEGVKSSFVTVVLRLRLPRTIAVILVGGALSMCGCVYQGIFKNPMADPYILGISSMGALGATIGIIFGGAFAISGFSATCVFAFFFAFLSVIIVYLISRKNGSSSNFTLLLAGLALGQLATAVVSLLMMLFSSQMKEIVFWTLGSFSKVQFSDISFLVPIFAVSVLFIFSFAPQIDVMSLGEENAARMGLDTKKVKFSLFIISALLVATCVCICGIIGFVGLIAPHIARMFFGPSHKELLMASLFTGSITLLISDVISRIALPTEIPVGIVLAILGAPFFVYLLNKKKETSSL